MIECDGWAGADCTDKVAGNILLLICFGICLCRCLCLCLLTVLSSFNDCPLTWSCWTRWSVTPDITWIMRRALTRNTKQFVFSYFVSYFLLLTRNTKHFPFFLSFFYIQEKNNFIFVFLCFLVTRSTRQFFFLHFFVFYQLDKRQGLPVTNNTRHVQSFQTFYIRHHIFCNRYFDFIFGAQMKTKLSF